MYGCYVGDGVPVVPNSKALTLSLPFGGGQLKLVQCVYKNCCES